MRNVFLADVDEEIEALFDILKICEDGLECPGEAVQPLGSVWSVNDRIQRDAFTAVIFLGLISA